MSIHKNMRLREALSIAARLGCTTELESGEVLVRHPAFRSGFRVSVMRHDTPQCLVSALRKLATRGVK